MAVFLFHGNKINFRCITILDLVLIAYLQKKVQQTDFLETFVFVWIIIIKINIIVLLRAIIYHALDHIKPNSTLPISYLRPKRQQNFQELTKI